MEATPQELMKMARDLLLLAAWQSGELTESQTASLMGLDIVGLRLRLECVQQAAREMWAAYRLVHAPVAG